MRSAEEGKFMDTGRETELDAKKRITLGAAIPEPDPGVRYRILRNDLGQILLDPVKSVPAYEAWVYENPDRIASITRGIRQAKAGKTVKIDLGRED